MTQSPPTPLKICFALPKLVPGDGGIIVGGSANAALTLGLAMARHGADVRILAPVPRARLDALAAHGAAKLVVPIVYSKAGKLGVVQGLRCLRLLVKSIDGRQLDVLHSHSGTFPYALVPLAKRRASVRLHSLYCPLQGNGGAYSRWWDRQFLARAVLRRLDAVIAVSDNVLRSLDAAGIHRDGVSMFPMTVDTARFSPRPAPSRPAYFPVGSAPRLLFVGNASVEKGLRNLVDALGLLAHADLRPHLVVTLENASGVKDYERELTVVKAKLGALGLEKQVTFLGLVADMPRLYGEADVVVIPWTTTRGPSDLPMVALEAMAMRKCVVSTPVGGCPELLRGGRAGRLTADFSAGSLAEALREVVTRPELRGALGASAEEAASAYSADAGALKMLQLYADIAKRKRNHVT